MAISRAQMLKELLPGLNALFGLEYNKYEDEHAEIYETESSDRSFEEEVKLSGFAAAQLRTKVQLSAMILRKSLLLLGITTRQLRWVSQLQKKLWRTTFMTHCLLVIPRHWQELWLTLSKSKLLILLTTVSLIHFSLVTGKPIHCIW